MLKLKFSGAHVLAAFVLVLLVVAAPTAQGGVVNYVTNGDFEVLAAGNNLSGSGSTGGYFCKTGTTCTSNVASWTSTCHSPSSCGGGGTPDALLFADSGGSAFNGGIGLWAMGTDGLTANSKVPNSPTGGNFVAFDGDSSYNASISQTITGLTPGATYLLSFWQGAAQQNGTTGDTTEQWKVTFANQTQNSTVMNNVSHGWVGWNQQFMTFTVSASSTGTEVLKFLSQGTPGGEPPVVLLDGISLVATPEPAMFGLVGLALVAVPLFGRKRAKRARQNGSV